MSENRGVVKAIIKIAGMLALACSALGQAWAGPTTTTLAVTPKPAGLNQTVTMTATVAGTSPTGTVTFKNGSTTLGTSSLSGTTAVFATAFTSTGTKSLTATYNGNAGNSASTSSAVSLTVNTKANTATALVAIPSPAAAAQTVTLTATVTGNNPTGTVTFKNGTTTLGTGTLSGGVATLNTSFATAGSKSLTARYGGNSANNTSTSSAVSLTVNKANSTTSLTSFQNPADGGQTVQLMASVAGATPGGTVTLKEGSTTLGTITLSGGSGSLLISNLALGNHTIAATYNGDSNNNTSTSPSLVQQMVSRASTSTTLSANPAAVQCGQSFVLTAVVAGSNPTGGVVFTYVPFGGGLSAAGTAVLAGGIATITVPYSIMADAGPANQLEFSASYGGDSANKPSSSPGTFVSNTFMWNSTTSVSASPNPSTFGQVVSLSSVVSASLGGTPTGSVTFKDGNATLGSVNLASGTATFSTSTLIQGSHALTAVYVGSSSNCPSTSTVVNQTVNAGAATPVNLSAMPNPIAVGQNVALTAAVGGTSPTGNVTFKDGAAILGTGTLSAGTASLSVALNSAGAHSLTASYGGDANNPAGNSSAVPVNVRGATSSVALALSTNKVQPSTAFTLTATVTGSNPTGSITFRDGATVIGTSSLVGGQAALSASLTTQGVHSLVATYAGDVTNNASTSDTETLLVSTDANAPAPLPAMSWAYEYNAKGSRTKVTDGNGLVTQHGYDPLEQRTQTTQPEPVPAAPRPTIGMAYDGQGNVTQVTDPRSLNTSYTVTGLGTTTQQVSPDTGATGATYNELGQPLVVTDARGKTATYAYDALNRVASITYSSGTPTVYTWDGGANPPPNSKGKLTGISDESGTTAYTYDGLGRVQSKTQVTGPSAKTFTVQYGYGSSGNALGKLQSITYPSGVVVTYGYDGAGRPNAVNISGPAGNKTVLSGLAYNALNQPQSWLWGDGTLMQRSFDAYGRLASYPLGNPNGSGIAAGALRTVHYDAAGRITGYSHASPGAALDQVFAYNGLDRLTSAVQGANSFGYAYDATGNRTQAVINGTAYNHSVSATSNRYASIQAPGAGGPQTQSQGYDNAGNLTSDAQGSYTYSDRGRLQSATRAGNTVNYLVNALQQRVLKTGPSAIITTGQAYYVYDESSRVIGEYDANGGLVQETVFLGDTPVGVVKGDGSLGFIYSDHLGTPRVITRSSGDHAVVWRWESTEAFGNTVANANPNGLGSYEYNLRFPGQVADQESGWYYNVNRDYNPSLGRYLQSDPIGLAGGINTYAYVGGRPLDFSDPTGQCPWCVGAFLGAGGNFLFQLGVNYIANGRDLKKAFRCVNWASVGIAGAVGAGLPGIGGTVLTGFKSATGMFGGATGAQVSLSARQTAVGMGIKGAIGLSLPPNRLDDDECCENSGLPGLAHHFFF